MSQECVGRELRLFDGWFRAYLFQSLPSLARAPRSLRARPDPLQDLRGDQGRCVYGSLCRAHKLPGKALQARREMPPAHLAVSHRVVATRAQCSGCRLGAGFRTNSRVGAARAIHE